MDLGFDGRYGGTVAGKQEFNAIVRSVKKSIKTGGWQTASEAKAFEEESAAFLGVKHGILTTSGSAAGLLALSAMELPKGSEVIIPAVTFPTIFNIILQCGLMPVVVDCKVGTYNIDLDKLSEAITDKTRAIIAVHAVGNPVDMPRLMEMVLSINIGRARGHQKPILVLEDNCDGWGSSINGKMVGSFGHVSITSFHAAHIISTGGTGGGVYTNDSDLAKRVRMYRDWGRQADTNEPNKYPEIPSDYNPRFVYEKIGYNFQILEAQAAMGRVQLKKANKIKKARQRNYEYLVNKLSGLPTLTLPSPIPNADICWFALPLSTTGDRGYLVRELEAAGIETRSMFAGNIIKHPAYWDSVYRIGNDLSGANEIMRKSFWITVHPRLRKKDLDYIVNVFENVLKYNR